MHAQVETEDFEEDKMETLGGDAVDKAGEEAARPPHAELLRPLRLGWLASFFGQAGGIVWKYSSDAEYEGTTISSFTKHLSSR